MRSPCEDRSSMDLAAIRRFVSRWRIREDEFALLDDLSDGVRADLTALVWMANGLYCPAELAEARFEAGAAQSPAMFARLMATPLLADRIEAGIARMSTPPVLH